MGQTITINTIIKEVPKLTPSLPSSAMIIAGAASLKIVANAQEASIGLRLIRNIAASRTMILSVALVAASVPFTLGLESLNARKIADSRKQSAEAEATTIAEEMKV